jgi:hypothetical protein
MSFIYSRALVEESLQVNCGEIDAYAPLNLIPMPKPSLSRDKTTEPFRRSRFGMTFEPLTDADGAELLMSWLGVSHAKTLVRPAQVTASTAKEADSGPKWRASFARYSPSESKWKTAQYSLLGGLDEFSETWPRWGSMRNGESFLLPTPALPICESESGFWPTPTASLASKGGRVTPRKGREGGTLIEAISRRMYPTPVENDTGHRKTRYAQGGTALSTSVGGQLNPEWVEWLMGWPIGHTALEPLATAKYQEWLRQHSPSLATLKDAA